MTKAFPEQRFSVLTIGVTDRATLTRFYQGALGFTLMESPGISFFDMGGIVLGLWERDKLAKDAGATDTAGTGYRGFALAYNARSEAEVDEIFARLATHEGATITVAPHKSFWGGYSGYFADPEGNAWEVAFNPFWPLDEAGRLQIPAPGAKND